MHHPLLSIINEPDDNHNAESHEVAIATMLTYFGKTISQCGVIVGDNCSVNKRFARIMSVPLVGCASHRLNLAVAVLAVPFEAELSKIQQLMIKLKTLNQSAKLRWVCFGLFNIYFKRWYFTSKFIFLLQFQNEPAPGAPPRHALEFHLFYGEEVL